MLDLENMRLTLDLGPSLAPIGSMIFSAVGAVLLWIWRIDRRVAVVDGKLDLLLAVGSAEAAD
jgi:hypothetical protein